MRRKRLKKRKKEKLQHSSLLLHPAIRNNPRKQKWERCLTFNSIFARGNYRLPDFPKNRANKINLWLLWYQKVRTCDSNFILFYLLLNPQLDRRLHAVVWYLVHYEHPLKVRKLETVLWALDLYHPCQTLHVHLQSMHTWEK